MNKVLFAYKRNLKRQVILLSGLFVLLLFFHVGYGQSTFTTEDSIRLSKEIDIFDVLRDWTKKPVKVNKVPKEGENNLSLLPIIGYSPANGAVVGAAISVTKYLGDPKTTQLSSALVNVSFTTENQILLNLRFDIYLSQNKWYISGDNRLLFFTQPTYGLGIYGLNSQPRPVIVNGQDVAHSVSKQPMMFNYIRFYETFTRKLYGNWYAGLGLMIDDHYAINDQSLKVDTPNILLTSHYLYSKRYDFDTAKYSTNGLLIKIVEDSRDNPVSAFKGTYLNVGFRYNLPFLGSSQQSTMLYYEWRNYFSLSKNRPRNVLAFWVWGVSVTSGNVPYLALPSITWDTYNRSGRGYIQGRFRGKDMLYGESEFRFQISKNGFFGGVVFVNGTTASNPVTGQNILDAIAPGVGFGVRLKMNKNDRTNICIDYGRGYDFSGIYFNIREAF